LFVFRLPDVLLEKRVALYLKILKKMMERVCALIHKIFPEDAKNLPPKGQLTGYIKKKSLKVLDLKGFLCL
jgi:hypothetical protein